ncbi:DCC-interacting protein 13-alpha [Ameca splendens]|uniref:DCC-interacting protein 13-alpha n=1 Tax=Ameca splendens TaxID=208324 RepID=A0ABV1A4V3_9TELE
MEEELGQMQQTIQEMENSCDPLYAPCDPDPTHSPVCRNLTRKQGYLYIRNKTGLVSSSWERQYFFTQGGNLMHQSRGEVAGGLVTDLDNCSVMAIDSDDRRFCFQVTSFDGKKVVTLQAESRKDCEEWIATINNISRRIYLSENAEVCVHFTNVSNLINPIRTRQFILCKTGHPQRALKTKPVQCSGGRFVTFSGYFHSLERSEM